MPMATIFIVSFAVAFILALLEELIELLTDFLFIKRTINAVITIALCYLGFYLLGEFSIKELLVYVLAASFLARTFLSLSEKVTTYVWSSTRQLN